MGITLVGESLNDLADPRLRTRRRSDGTPPLTAATTAVPGGDLDDATNLSGLEARS